MSTDERRVREFDSEAAINAGFENTKSIFGKPAEEVKKMSATSIFAQGARWQFEQDSAAFDALKAENERLNKQYTDDIWSCSQMMAKKDDELARAREVITSAADELYIISCATVFQDSIQKENATAARREWEKIRAFLDGGSK